MGQNCYRLDCLLNHHHLHRAIVFHPEGMHPQGHSSRRHRCPRNDSGRLATCRLHQKRHPRLCRGILEHHRSCCHRSTDNRLAHWDKRHYQCRQHTGRSCFHLDHHRVHHRPHLAIGLNRWGIGLR